MQKLEWKKIIRYSSACLCAIAFGYCFINSFTLAFMYYDFRAGLSYMLIGLVFLSLYLILCLYEKTLKLY